MTPEEAAPPPSGFAPLYYLRLAFSLVRWDDVAESELKKIPFFVRGKARRNTEAFAAERGLATITRDTLYDAKAHYAR